MRLGRVTPGDLLCQLVSKATHLAAQRHVARFEREYLEALLRRHQGNVKTAAEEACLPRGTLYRLMKNHGLDGDDFRS